MASKNFMVCWISNWNVLPIVKDWEVVSAENLDKKLDDLIEDGVNREDIKIAEYLGS